MHTFRIAVLAGDGIGPEVMAPCLAALDVVVDRAGDFALTYERHPAGAALYQRTGVALPEATLRLSSEADAILLGAMGLPNVRTPSGTEIVPQIDLREKLHLYAGVRPVRMVAPRLTPLASPRARDLDYVLIRESTEGLFSAREQSRRDGDAAVFDTMQISRSTSERLFTFAFELARRRKPRWPADRTHGQRARVTCVDKANVLPSMAFFRRIFLEVAAAYPDVDADCAYVDAVALRLVRSPWDYDVLVTENMFGDILSDLGAGLIGGMGMAASADIGDTHAVFQPCHGTAPDIMGQGKANPTAMFLSAAMMLEWLGDRHGIASAVRAGKMLTVAVERAFEDPTLVPTECGGEAGTEVITKRVMDRAQ